MKHLGKIFLLFLLCQIQGVFAQEIDYKNSSIQFVATNLGVGVDGQFRKFSGTIHFSPDSLEKSDFHISIPIKSINTGNGMRDEHLQEEEFFHATVYPNIIFTSKKIDGKGEQFTVVGMLEIKGETKEVSIPFTYNDHAFTGEFTINRNDFKIGEEDTSSIGNEIKIKIKCTLKSDE